MDTPLTAPDRAVHPAAAHLAVDSIALTVRDLPGVAAFYRDAIGLKVVAQEADRVGLGAGGTVLLDLIARPGARPGDPGEAGLFHTAFLLPTRADMGRWLVHCSRTGVRLAGASDHLVSEAAYLEDPEGNGIEVYVDRPAAQWRWHGEPGARRIEMANRPFDAEGLMRAGGTTQWDGVPAGTRIGHVHLRVGDVAEAARFYGGLLGLDVTANWPDATFLSSGGYHHHVGTNTWQSAGAGPRDPTRAGLAAVTFTATDLAGIARRTGVADIVRDGLTDPWGTSLRFQAAPRSEPHPDTAKVIS